MATLEQIAQQAALNGGLRKNYGERQPSQYADKQFEYFSNTTHLFREEYLEYASDFFEAEIQNWDKDGEWETVYIRMADVVRPSAAIQRHFDQYKMVIPRDPSINYLQPGTKLRAMGSYWIVVNPINISGGEGSGIVQRCNAVWNHLDWYGNIVSEPIIVQNDRANASAPDSQTDQRIATGYYNVTCQYNEFTKQVNDNTRLILGSKAYQVTGYGDFDTEFTGDYGSVRLLNFAIRVLTQNDETDDMENHVAGGKAFSFSASMNGLEEITTGEVATYFAKAYRNGKEVGSTTEHPVNWIWKSSKPNVASVSPSSGESTELTANQTGYAVITATLEENTSVSVSRGITVTKGSEGVRFYRQPPTSLDPYETCQIAAAYYDGNGYPTGDAVTFTISGAQPGSYSSYLGGNSVWITCIGYSETPITVTAECNGVTNSVSFRLNGF